MAKVKNRYPTNAVRNKYQDNRKESCINTPPNIAHKIFDIVSPFLTKKQIRTIIDIGCGSGNLSRPFADYYHYKIFGCDIKKANFHSTFIKADFLKEDEYYFESSANTIILCNPPFNDSKSQYGKKLLPELFLRRIFSIWGPRIPTVLISPMGLLKNQRMASPRWKWIRDCGCRVSSELEIPVDAYGQGIMVHSSVLFFNFTGLRPRYFLGD